MDELRTLLLSVGHELVSIVIAGVGAWVSSKIHSKVKQAMKDLNGYFNGLRTLADRVTVLENELKQHTHDEEE